MKNKVFSIIICFLVLALTIVLSMSPKVVKADNSGIYCPLCTHRNDDDPIYKKERQFYEKIHLVKEVFGNSIDEVVLAATVLHRYTEDAYNSEYSENFDAVNYKTAWENFLSSGGSYDDSSELAISEEDQKMVQENRKLDLITTATIVMLDSDNFSTFDEDAYKKALAGDKLFGNDKGFFGGFLNGVVCGAAQTFNVLGAIPEFVSTFFSGNNIIVASESVANRLVDTKNVCENGYIGGIYDGVSSIQDEKRKQNIKDTYAQQIIDLANYYKKLYGAKNTNNCANNLAGTTGSYSDWKQYDNSWGSVPLGVSGKTIKSAGCLVTSVAMQISRSGTSLGTLPNGYSEFNPGAFVTSLNNHDGFASNANFRWTGFSEVAPNWRVANYVGIGSNDSSRIASLIEGELSTPYDGKYQKFLVIHMYHNGGQHWVAVSHVKNGQVIIMDPGRKGNTLEDNYSGENWTVEGYKVMYATDVMFGQVGTSTLGSSNACSSDDLQGIIGFLTYIEGAPTCNYKGQGEGTGYKPTWLNDGNGYTTALGITHWDSFAAEEVGYTDFLSELQSGQCMNKQYIDQMLPIIINHLGETMVDPYANQKGVTLTGPQRMMMISLEYGGNYLSHGVIDAMASYGSDSNEVLTAFKNSYNPAPEYRYGLGLRRMAEYEVFMTGNYNAAKPSDHFKNDNEIQKATMQYIKSYWPTSRA